MHPIAPVCRKYTSEIRQCWHSNNINISCRFDCFVSGAKKANCGCFFLVSVLQPFLLSGLLPFPRSRPLGLWLHSLHYIIVLLLNHPSGFQLPHDVTYCQCLTVCQLSFSSLVLVVSYFKSTENSRSYNNNNNNAISKVVALTLRFDFLKLVFSNYWKWIWKRVDKTTINICNV